MQMHFTVTLDEDGSDLSRAISAMMRVRDAVYPITKPPAETAAPPAPPAAPSRGRKAAAAEQSEQPAQETAKAAITKKDLEALAKPLIQRGLIEDIRTKLKELGANPPKLDNLAPEKYADLAAYFKKVDEPVGSGDDTGL